MAAESSGDPDVEGGALLGEDALEVGFGIGSASESEPHAAIAASRNTAVATENVPENFVMAESIRPRGKFPREQPTAPR